MSCKTLFIGLDGLEPELLDRWCDEQQLPNLAKLRQQYQQLPVISPRGFGDGGLWSCLVTGVNPGKHGHYFPEQINPKSYMLDPYSLDTDLQRDPFWFFCSLAGQRVGVIDVYTSPLRTGLNGIQVMDWMIHDRMGAPRSWPSTLIDSLHENYMVDPLGGNSEANNRNDDDFVKMHADILTRIDAKTRATVDLLGENNWDLFCIGFCDAHDVGHQSWHWHDPEMDNHPAELVAQHGNPLLQCYQALDQAVAKILSAGEADNVFLVGGLGMGKQSLCNVGLQQVLAHYCGIDGDRNYTVQQRQKMRFFELPHNMHGGAIRINLRGRESQGIVEPEEYDKELKSLADKLVLLRDADSGEEIVREIVYVHEEYPGNYQNNLPDMFVVWHKPLNVKRIRIDENKVIDLQPNYDFEFRSGDHTDQALFLSSNQYQEDTIRAEAIGATVCATLGVNLPESDSPALALAAD